MIHSVAFWRVVRRSPVGLLRLLVCLAPIVACAQQTDTTIAVQPNARIQIQNFAGSIRVRGWDRNAVRIVAGESRRDEVRVQGRDAAVSISTVSRSGVPAPLDYEVTVPVRASLDIGGTYTAISIEGVRGSVSATTVQGEVTLRGGDGVISLKSVEGAVTVQDAVGRIEVNGVNKGLTLRNVNRRHCGRDGERVDRPRGDRLRRRRRRDGQRAGNVRGHDQGSRPLSIREPQRRRHRVHPRASERHDRGGDVSGDVLEPVRAT